MKYYEFESSGGDCRFCYPHIDEKSPWCKEMLSSNEYKEIHELPIRLIVENEYQPNDFILSTNKIISKKMNDIIKGMNKNFTSFESQMYFNDKKIWDLYYTIVLPKYKIFNWEKSEYETEVSRVTNKQVVTWIDRIVLDEKKIELIRDDNFFTMEEKPTRCYCTETGKNAIEGAGLIGITFEEVPVE